MSRFYDYQCTQCPNDKLYEYYEPTEVDKKVTHKCPNCGFEMHRKITMPMVNFRAARGNEQNRNLSKAERQRKWNSPSARDKI